MLDNIRIGAEQLGRKLEDIKLFMRLACAVLADRDKVREQVKGFAAAAAYTTFQTVPRKYFPDQLWDELSYFNSKYDLYQHGENQAKHNALLTDRIIDGIAVAGAPMKRSRDFRRLPIWRSTDLFAQREWTTRWNSFGSSGKKWFPASFPTDNSGIAATASN